MKMDKNTASKMPDQTLMDKKYMPTGGEALNDTEMGVLKDLDPDKLSDMAEVLYAFNNYRVGPMPVCLCGIRSNARKGMVGWAIVCRSLQAA